MSLLNAGNSYPQYLLVAVRYLAHVGKPIGVDQFRAVLCPPGTKDQKVFDSCVDTLVELGLAQRSGTDISLAVKSNTDTDSIVDNLRSAVLASENNTGLGENSAQTGPRDLVRALCWYLTLDPVNDVLGWSDVQQRQPGSIKSGLGDPIVNDTRWNPFCSWSSALGFCTPALMARDGSTAARLMSDCTTAVRRTVRILWRAGDSVEPLSALGELREALPVLPGGRYSTEIGIESPGPNYAGPSLSFALLRGHDEKWLRLEQDDDARHLLHLHDPDQPDFPRTFSSITVLEVPRG
ncbi:hypothetical protein L6E12_16490 [Actinokineospora sp. PR83]|uniref:protein DpdG n=1 Tax=Actinokineospora sp. PR83 TaxID=2884908 RepID=UPI001F239598|nr:protein DpdG [Actinokineospora sp. PR83]MCG8917385.1 hypothetical protein [Actinokineospora sp. PR83]